MTTIAIAILAILLPLVAFDLAARPTIRRLALRNVSRRPGEAALVVGGALLATALITASFIIGDSFGRSIRNLAVDRLGPVDELVIVTDPSQIEPTLAVIAAGDNTEELIDGTLGATRFDVAVASASAEPADRRVEPEARVLEVDPGAAVAFADDDQVLGSVGAELAAGSAVLNETIASELGVAAGEDIEVFVGGEPVALRVAAVRATAGLNGFGDLIVPTGSITNRFDDANSVVTSMVLVSNVGDVFSGAELTADVVADLEASLGSTVVVEDVKRDLLEDAESEAAEMTELFGTIGGFSVAAGVLLVINLFVMLAGERKAEMGTMRATGLRRSDLIRSLALEGAVYGLAAAAVGTIVGIGVAALVMAFAGTLFDGDITIVLAVIGTSLVSGAVIGFAVSQLTVVLTAWRVTRLNIVRALRDLPEPSTAGASRRSLVLGVVGIAIGIGLYLAAGTTPIVAMLAPVIAMVSTIPLLSRLIPGRVAVAICCGLALAWTAAVFGLLPEVMKDPEVFLFLLQGVLLVGLATAIVAVGDRVWLGITRRVTGGGIASRIGMAEPLARPVRTSLLVAMYALVIFTVTFMAVMNSVFQAQAPDFAANAGGSYALIVDSNPTAGLRADELTERDDVAHAAPVVRGWATGSTPALNGGEPQLQDWRLTGVDESFLVGGPPPLAARSDRFGTDAQVWEAVASGEPLVLTDADWGLEPGDDYVFYDTDRVATTFTVAGTIEQGWLVGAWAYTGDELALDLYGDDRPPTRHYLTLELGADPASVADDLNATGVERGVDATTFLAAAKAETDAQQGFLYMLQGFLGLGLLIGIAGLGVVLVRAVRERRRQFGVMRALGIAAPVVRRAFIVEAAFVALQGVTLGIALGILSSWQVLTRSTAFEANLEFTVPAPVLLALAAGCLLASLAMAAVPAIRAGRTTPAVALRVT
ncbi:MAG: ABC transporter permease [Acidimicrobiales bacterium]